MISEFALPGGEDRGAVLAQLQFLKGLYKAEPKIAQVAGHDIEMIRSFIQTDIMKPMFRAANAPWIETDTLMDSAEGTAPTGEPADESLEERPTDEEVDEAPKD